MWVVLKKLSLLIHSERTVKLSDFLKVTSNFFADKMQDRITSKESGKQHDTEHCRACF